MPQKPKTTNPPAEHPKKIALKDAPIVEDQNSRDYYYDDSHGYQTYQPDDDVEENDDKAIEP